MLTFFLYIKISLSSAVFESEVQMLFVHVHIGIEGEGGVYKMLKLYLIHQKGVKYSFLNVSILRFLYSLFMLPKLWCDAVSRPPLRMQKEDLSNFAMQLPTPKPTPFSRSVLPHRWRKTRPFFFFFLPHEVHLRSLILSRSLPQHPHRWRAEWDGNNGKLINHSDLRIKHHLSSSCNDAESIPP